MRAEHPSEPCKPPAHIVELSRFVGKPEYPPVFGKEKGYVARSKKSSNVLTKDVSSGASSKESGGFRSSRRLEIALKS